jgi:hypothetical protein
MVFPLNQDNEGPLSFSLPDQWQDWQVVTSVPSRQ